MSGSIGDPSAEETLDLIGRFGGLATVEDNFGVAPYYSSDKDVVVVVVRSLDSHFSCDASS